MVILVITNELLFTYRHTYIRELKAIHYFKQSNMSSIRGSSTVTGYQSISSNPSSPDTQLFLTDPSSRERTVNIVVGFVTSIMVFITLISAFIFNDKANRGLNITFAVVIIMICLSHLLLIYWYRQGDVDPKFKKLILINALCISLLCICANIYFHGH